MSGELRRAKAADAGEIAELLAASWRAAYEGILTADDLDLDTGTQATRWARRLDNAEVDTWVAAADGSILGFESVGPARGDDSAPGRGEVYAIYVLPERFREGIGRRLMEQALADLGSRGYTD